MHPATLLLEGVSENSKFGLHVSGCGNDSMYVYKDPVRAVAVIRSKQADDTDLARHLTPGRTVTPRVGAERRADDEHGRLAIVSIIRVQREDTTRTRIRRPVR